jgi:hypothetical protein
MKSRKRKKLQNLFFDEIIERVGLGSVQINTAQRPTLDFTSPDRCEAVHMRKQPSLAREQLLGEAMNLSLSGHCAVIVPINERFLSIIVPGARTLAFSKELCNARHDRNIILFPVQSASFLNIR